MGREKNAKVEGKMKGTRRVSRREKCQKKEVNGVER